MDAYSFNPTVAAPCPALLVGHRSGVIRVLQIRVVATQEKICGTGTNGKKIRLLIGQGGLPKSILANLCSNLIFR